MEPPRERIRNHAEFIWSVADLLRGDYKRSEYGRVILPLVVIRRLDCVLEPTKKAVLDLQHQIGDRFNAPDPLLEAAAGQKFYNTSPLDFLRLLDDPPNLADNLNSYLDHFSATARDAIDKFEFKSQVARLAKVNLLFLVVARFADMDFHPDKVSNIEMGAIYEELIRKFSEESNETAGEHFTPRDVIRLMVRILFAEDQQRLGEKGKVQTLYDPACGTGGMLSVAEDALRLLNPTASLKVFGQELNPETFAICRSDMMLKGQDATNIHFGNSFTDDGEEGRRFDYMLANPPFGVEWKKVKEEIEREAQVRGFGGRFGAGLPRINDGSFLFLQHMLAKMKSIEDGGTRLAIVFNGSPLFTGGAGSGESEIRRWIIENDWLEAVVALPDQLFYNTGISTYFWVLTNRKRPERRGKVQLVDARELFVKMRKSLGDKRKEISVEQADEIATLYSGFTEGERVKILPNESFGFLRITVERPLRQDPEDPDSAPVLDRKGNPAPDPKVRDGENVPLPAGALSFVADPTERLASRQFRDAVDDYVAAEVRPYVPGAWVDYSKTKISYEIPLTRHFYRYVPPRPLEEIDAELRELESEVQRLLAEVTGR